MKNFRAKKGLVVAVFAAMVWFIGMNADVAYATETGSMKVPRSGHTATLLVNGKVLITGGDNSNNTQPYLNSAELYDPSTGTFSYTGNMTTGRSAHTATLLKNGKVLITGGLDKWETNHTLNSAEIYDPATGTFTPTGSMNAKRESHHAVLLNDGRVLVSGGLDNEVPVSGTYLHSAEIYDPATGIFTPTGNMNEPRIWFSAVLLKDGRVLVAGGSPNYGGWSNTSEIYDPATGRFTYSGNLITARWIESAVLLSDGNVLFAGGNSHETQLNSAEIYNSATGTFSAVENMNSRRSGNSATLLSNGDVLIAGGYGGAYLNSAEIYDTANHRFTLTDTNMVTPRYGHKATKLIDGRVLLTGGTDGNIILSSAELYGTASESSSFVCGVSTVQDADGNTYGTTNVNGQCWMKENLRVGTMVSGVTTQTNNGVKEKYCYGNDPANCLTDGGLYQWDEAMQYSTTEGAGGMCPAGWHIPTDAEQFNLENYLKDVGSTCSASRLGVGCDGAATKLQSILLFPLSGYRQTDGSFVSRSVYTYFWSSTSYGVTAWSRGFENGDSRVNRNYGSISGGNYGFSVRCIQNSSISPTNHAPVITLYGDNPMTLNIGDTFTDPGATANDAEDGNIATSSIVVIGTVDTSTAGTYTRRYNVTDSQGLSATEVTRTVVVVAQPPVADFTFSPQNPKAGDTIHFDAAGSIAGSGSIIQYEWDLNGDGIFEIYPSPQMDYSWSIGPNIDGGGNIVPTLKVTNSNNLSVFASKTIQLSSTPTSKANYLAASVGNLNFDWINFVWPFSNDQLKDFKAISKGISKDYHAMNGGLSDETVDKKPYSWLENYPTYYKNGVFKQGLTEMDFVKAIALVKSKTVIEGEYREVSYKTYLQTGIDNDRLADFAIIHYANLPYPISVIYEAVSPPNWKDVVIGATAAVVDVFTGGPYASMIVDSIAYLVQTHNLMKNVDQSQLKADFSMYISYRIIQGSSGDKAWDDANADALFVNASVEDISKVKKQWDTLYNYYCVTEKQCSHSVGSGLTAEYRQKASRRYAEAIISALNKAIADKIITPRKQASAGDPPPVEVRVIDENGNISGVVNGQVLLNIPNSVYDPETLTVTVFDPKSELHYLAVGTGNETYDLVLNSIADGETTNVTMNDVVATLNSSYSVSVDWDATTGQNGVKFGIDKNGDGVLEQTLQIGNLFSDTLAPTTTPEISGTLGTNDWYTGTTTAALTATDNDDGVGVEETLYALDNGAWQTYSSTSPIEISADGVHALQYYSVDWFGNTEATSTLAVKIDKTAPEVAVVTPANGGEYLLHQNVVADWSAGDAVSGLLSAVGTTASGALIDTGTVGEKTHTVTATDNAGNVTVKTITYSVRYDYGGILQPINGNGTSIFKFGSTVPVKFQLKDANGNFITTAIAKIYLSKLSDGVYGTEFEADSASAASTGNQFRYDAVANQYIFNLSTKPLSIGTWQIRIALDDGSSEIVDVSLK